MQIIKSLIKWKLGEARCIIGHCNLSVWTEKARQGPKQHPWESVLHVTMVNGFYSEALLFRGGIRGMVWIRVCVLPGEGHYNKSIINIELKQGELTNGSSCRACMGPTVNNSILC